MRGGGLKGALAAKAREELEGQERDLRKGVPRNSHPGTRGVAMKSPHRRPPSVVSDDESVYGGGDAKAMRLRASERNKARTEALKHKSRMVATQGLGAANPVFTEADPFWDNAWQVVNPRHRYVQMWDLMTLHLLVFTALVTPYEISFMDGLGGVNVEMLFWVNQLINIIFLVDMWLVFVTPFEGEDGIWVTSKRELDSSRGPWLKGCSVSSKVSPSCRSRSRCGRSGAAAPAMTTASFHVQPVPSRFSRG